MNPQYLPPQQYGGPPQQYGGPPQGIPSSRTSPTTTTPPQFQNVPLGPQKPQGDHGSVIPPSSTPGSFPPTLGRQTPQSQIPPSQLPPSADPNSPFGLPPSNKGDNMPPNVQNGPMNFSSNSPFHNGQVSGPPLSAGLPNRPPSNFTTQAGQNQLNQNIPTRPPSIQTSSLSHPPTAGQLPPLGQTPPQVAQQPQLGQNPSQIGQPTQLGQPQSHLGQPLSQLGQSPSQLGQSLTTQLGHPGQTPTTQLGQPPSHQGQPPSHQGQPPSHQGQPPSHQGQPPSKLGHPPSHLGQPPSKLSQPVSHLGQPPSQQGQPLSKLGQPPSQLGHPPSQPGQQLSKPAQPPSELGQQPLPQFGQLPAQPSQAPSEINQSHPPIGQPGSQINQLSVSSGPLSQTGPGVGLGHGGPPINFGQSNLASHGGPPGGPVPHLGQPTLGHPGGPVPHLGQPTLGHPGGPPSQIGSFPAIGQTNGPNMVPQSQFGPPPGMTNQYTNQMGDPPKPFAPQSRVGQPPLPGSQNVPGANPMQNISGPYPPGSQMPPYSQFGPNQLSSQMQGMNISGPNKYPPVPGAPGMPARGGINEMSPHMPPPGNQPGYVNGQQTRGPPGPGYPPMPGQPPLPGQMPAVGQGQYPGGGAYPQPNYQQPQQVRRLDPEQMPSPIQVTEEDQQNRSGIFVTNQKGLVPPLVTTNFIVQDQGNASPRFIRSNMYNVPISQDLMKQTAVPFSLVISPMARQVEQEYPPPIVNFGTLGPVRCIRCKAYMCPYMQFVDSGRRFQCLFCMATTDVPTEYFQHLDQTGQRMDRYERPELILGTYEFVATSDYCRNNTLPKPPAMIFIIDVSYNNIKSGMVSLLCSQMKEIIQNLPVDQGQEKSNMKVGFITYNSSVHFYNIKGTLAAPQMLVVGDVQEMFMPLLDGFLCTPDESGPIIDLLMQQIPTMFADTRETETVLLPAMQAGLEALKASECTGKLLVFHSTLPSAEAPGKLKNRDDRKLLGTDKEKTVLTPQTQAYNQLGQDCVSVGCSVDLFIFNNAYIDIATIGQVSRLTGGEVFKYTYFQADIDGERLINDIILNISRPIAFDAVMRVRTSTGVRPTDFYGHIYMSNTTDIELAAIDCDKAIGVEIKHDDKLSEDSGVYIQAALLYTSCSGQRRLRIMNLSLKTCSQMADLYRSCDLDTLINYLSKQACYKLLDNNPKAVKDSIVNRAAQILASYRKNCASPSSAGQLILPESMKLLPLYVNCLLKNDALSGGSDMTIDDRSFVMQAVMTMDVPTSVHYFYPRLIPLHDIDVSNDPVTVPNPIRCSIEKMNEQGVYILENGIHMFLWFGLGVNSDFIQKLFGAPSAIQVDIERCHLPELDNPVSVAIRNIIDEIRIQRHRCMRLTLVRQREKLENLFKHYLVEDSGTNGSPSYVDFLCHMHKEIRNLLS